MTLGDDPGEDHRRRGAERWHARRGWERRLHDGPALRLSALSLRLGVLRAEAPSREWVRGLDAFQDELGAALQELREVEGALYPPLLDEAGLGPALRELATATGATARIDAVDARAGTAAEGAAYFAAAACLAATGEGDGEVVVRVRVEGGDLVLTLDGVDAGQRGAVLDEAAPLGGSVDATPDGAGRATITARFPCA
ncbi:hypothetical protein Acsp06_61020 [Actinomycetospora sp. NBRC 106375]|uniref:histidine kinase n=1 Tax=Actinomycetospora sp. NBRC 106375 TaxID=3032207 RepID=UPI0024A54A0B|nr:histidine kinase [Actinomycetospora sp. NBRC 106375]GLZ49917.1 hypothetical protein Acsp06_61020 [Actinomycetospora sp. NBRC 106375]